MINRPILQILLPVYNEAESIEQTLYEIYDELSKQIALEFVICEDGSVDPTKQILQRLKESLPLKLLMKNERRGYTQAMIEGMKMMDAPYLLFLDSDGQCDPKDFWKFWESRDAYDVLIGKRRDRADSFMRRLISRGFYFVYQFFFHVPVHDPSCPFVLAHHHAVKTLLPELGEMEQGFWWEFIARAHRQGFSLGELPVSHRSRSAGKTKVYRLTQLAGIGYHHFLALFKIWAQIKSKP